MCGIAGFIDIRRSFNSEQLLSIGTSMGDRIAHRGPDSFGCWEQADAGVVLSHRRLAIIDLSPAGAQPMTSHSARYVITFNGEIYNYLELRSWLGSRAPTWRGHSDTEVLLECFAAFGVAATLERASGMFALALWDKDERTLTLARDRAGEKPLYYGFLGDTFVFASELKALKAHPNWDGGMNTAVLPSYLRFGYVPSPSSIYENIKKLPAGSYLTFSADQPSRALDIRKYWSWPVPHSASLTSQDVLDELELRLKRSVSSMMAADVPLGSFLSGGIDSSLVTAVMQSVSSRPVRTFSIGFEDPALNEAPFAAKIAEHLGTDHTELYVSASQALATVPDLGAIYDEPFADSSQIPTLLLSRLVRRHVTVALSGDAGDELFGGYDRYRLLARMDSALGKWPLPLRRGVSKAIGLAPAGLMTTVVSKAARGSGFTMTPQKMDRFRRIVGLPGNLLYQEMMSQIASPGSFATLVEPSNVFGDGSTWASIRPAGAWASYLDALTYLPDDILTKVDRASMDASLEVRVPLLDPSIIELSAECSWAIKTRGGVPKWPLQELLGRFVPLELFKRPKMGFGVPLAAWLRGELREWAGDTVHSQPTILNGLLKQDAINHLWREHLTNEQNNAAALWTIVMLKDWALRQSADASASAAHNLVTETV